MTRNTLLTDTQVQAYLRRLGVTYDASPSLELLNQLVYAHQCTIPFDTSTVYKVEYPPKLDLELSFDKIVTQKRGGYCFEMNLLFNALLTALGFNARPVFCRVIKKDGVRRPLSHRGNIVSLAQQDYYVDVGFGGPVAAGALALDAGVRQTIQHDTFEMRDLGDAWWSLDLMADANRRFDSAEDSSAYVHSPDGDIIGLTLLEVCTARVEEQDFEALNLYTFLPGAYFWEHVVLNRRTPQGNYSILDTTLTLNTEGVKQVIELPDRSAFEQALYDYFELDPGSYSQHCLNSLYN